MKKQLIVLGLGAGAVASAALVSAGVASSDPNASASPYNVVGEQYGQAVAILRSQGMGAMFRGSVGSDLPQAQCIVASQKQFGRSMALMLDCTEKAFKDAQGSTVAGGAGPRKVGSSGITTVTATPVGPQPGMPIPGA